MEHKAGFVNIIGLPNVGKSTLMNSLVGEQLSIITKKAQTTRHRILGIVNEPDFQIVFSDTPGYIAEPAYKMQEHMNSFVMSAIEDADVFLFITEMGANPEKQQFLIDRLQKAKVPVMLLVNKIDLVSNQEEVTNYMKLWEALLPKASILPISALHKFQVHEVIATIVSHLPESPPYYDKDQLTDKSERFFVSEIIREKILEQFKQEIPYSAEVEVEQFKEVDDIIRMSAVIYVERPTQKSIIIGKGGEAIKRLGIAARRKMEKFFKKHVHLELFVKVKDKWRNDDNMLKSFGYKN